MKIILDVMGGDNPPEAIVRGAIMAKESVSSRIVLVGNEAMIREALAKHGADENDFDIVHSDGVITMEDGPMCIVQKKKDSSMAKALTLLAQGEGDACVSCGNTGALFTGATLIVRRIKGVRRAALATIMPYDNDVMLIDSGANVTVTADYLVHFAYLGSIYMRKVYGLEAPRVAIINNGEEKHKGTPLVLEARELMLGDEYINFVGSVEGQELPYAKCDIAVCDGFTGNVILKTSEGLSNYITDAAMSAIKAAGNASEEVLGAMEKIRRRFDSTEYGGAVMIGLTKPVVKAHGSSDSNAIKNALICAEKYAKSDVTSDIEKAFEVLDPLAQLANGGKNDSKK